MSFTARLWVFTLLSFSAFTVWVYLHDELIPGLSPGASHGVVAGAAWIFGIVGTFFILRIHKRAEALAEKSARDETAIQLAGAVAHELNQPLTIIVSTSEIISRRDPQKDDLRPYLHQLIQASDRMSDIVQKLERVTTYRNKPYVGDLKIVDLETSSE